MGLCGLVHPRVRLRPMNTLPDKLPVVVGSGQLNKGFGLAFDAINKLIEAMRSLEPRSSPTVRSTSTSIGTTHQIIEQTPGQIGETRRGPARYS